MSWEWWWFLAVVALDALFVYWWQRDERKWKRQGQNALTLLNALLYVIIGGATMSLIVLELYAVGWLVNLRVDSPVPFLGIIVSGVFAQVILALVLILFYALGKALAEIL